ncbi:hypothetical protein KP509_10G002400 [Ceratopteris richardii]|uniref:Mitochondrial glycoprotein n=1 Tax=Ceratopteris richardii TaxID=49495 RepID=A0A8T2TXS9_CERRI|nr:hypothetical protein KP509_10G002400 [Ceratopteris richardii]
MSARTLVLRASSWAARSSAWLGRATDVHHQRFYRPALLASSTRSLYQRATYATKRSVADELLLTALKGEVDYELRDEAHKQGNIKGSARPFEVTDNPGTEEIILRRTYGNEEIAVTCILESQQPEEDEDLGEAHDEEGDEEEENDEASENRDVEVLHLNVTITKGERYPALEFECSFVSGGEEIEIESIAYLHSDSSQGKDDEIEPQEYTGPGFHSMQPNLQESFHKLLQARGLTSKVATYAIEYLKAKEHREYIRWLHNVETFFSS